MTGKEIRTAYANHLPIIYHHTDGGTVCDIEYNDIFSISYIIHKEFDGQGHNKLVFTMVLTLNDKCGHSQSTVPAKDCELANPDELEYCDYTPDISLPPTLYETFRKQKPIVANINGESIKFPRIRKLEMFLQTNGEILTMCTVGENLDTHNIYADDIILQ